MVTKKINYAQTKLKNIYRNTETASTQQGKIYIGQPIKSYHATKWVITIHNAEGKKSINCK